ncbi:hypothetical protein FZEAL_1040 [Fusarium zealandicum]|uniref:RING-type E3 ubiquitin transferase n=1 Tax=Fusarium zealandicum TaxID=1053134 RepID=A0A8H4UTJ4_9HYPO|nr:hypothetical protein FZEAL_1040 [Fusarium zealandicum]
MDDPTPSEKLKDLIRAATTRSDDASQYQQDAAPGICRICRGEATLEEPLFYPCKCSGSIKYVHQDCLMEWLSHSQKKYCELCKTSFRFTKLYAPDMPQSLPAHVFVGHLAKYMFRNVLAWLRAAMAVSVWLCWLPYFMRSVWSFMFWVSDEGLGNTSMLSRSNDTANAALQLASSSLDIDTCPASPLFARTTTSASAATALLETLSGQNISEFFMRIFLGSLGMPAKFDRSDSSSESLNTTAPDPAPTAPPSLLGDVAFLNNLTRNPTVNRTITSVLEGQIITILVIVCFILVILVRDYVVQQQPEMNMRAAFAVPENPLAPQEPPRVRRGDLANLHRPEESDDETLDDGELSVAATDEVTGMAFDEPASTRRFRRTSSNIRIPSALMEAEHSGPASIDPRLLPTNLSPAEERAMYDYLRIYRQADGDSERILGIIQAEGLQDKLAYWVDVTRRSIRDQDGGPSYDLEHPRTHSSADRPGSSGSTVASSSRRAFTPLSDEFPITLDEGSDRSAASKGKQKETLPQLPGEDFEIGSWRAGLSPSPSRPRAVSDGPQLHDSVNPLANNSWSFSALPKNSEVEEPSSQARSSLEHLASLGGDLTQIPDDGAGPSHLPNEISGFRAREQDHDLAIQDGQADVDEHTEAQLPVQANAEAVVEPDDGRGPGLVDRVTDFMWGDLVDQHAPQDGDPAAADNNGNVRDDEDDWEFDLDDLGREPPFDAGNEFDDEPEDLDAPGVGLDQEAMEDLEDFEGVMELVGMRGPVAGLFQNAIFCAVLVSVTIFACIFIPYNIGRVSVWIAANPMRLVRLLFELSKLLQDAAVMAAGIASWVVLNLIDIFTGLIGGFIKAQVLSARKASWVVWTSAGARVVDYAFMDFPMSAAEMQNFSAISHGALLAVKGNIGAVFTMIGEALSFIFGGGILSGGLSLEAMTSAANIAWSNVAALPSALLNPNSWVINLSEPEGPPPVSPELAFWSGLDRFWAILAGYVTLFFIGAMYLKRGSPFSRGHILQAWEGGVIDTLHQASGIMKVIMIISIEMLVFPLYCGLLLDGALLPLFENTTFKSRILFTYNYPLTSAFVHWFVGTGYMFHFALFVSMCRKIMRQGVLYFIRDPDDPEFHPVRDVLERNLTTQLRKILFSAFVYGALVIVCLGGVVWGLSYSVPNVLPVHYSSNEPVLEFPVDLLFYNFLMPLAVNFFKPGDGLHAMYTWWFRTCARGLRLTFFLFGERKVDEEGCLRVGDHPKYQKLPWYKTLFLELNHKCHVVPKDWKDFFDGGDAKPKPPLTDSELRSLTRRKNRLKDANQLVESGYFVRAPASDRVKIPKGKKVFQRVDERGRRREDQAGDLYSSTQYQMVYIPPHFRARIFLFISFIWVFAAVTGVGFTIIPLVFGRRMFKMLIPEHIRTNDIYAFSIGVYLLGSFAYLVFHIRSVWANVQRWMTNAMEWLAEGGVAPRVASVLLRGVKLVYAYFFLLIVFPLLVSGLMELYLAIPLHTYMYPPTAESVQASREGGSEASRHTVRVIQAWTLGLLYLKLGARMVTTLFAHTRLAVAVRTVLRQGWMHPDIGVLTRAFVVPGLAISAAAVLGPPTIVDALVKYGVIDGAQPGADELAEVARLAVVYRQSYPAVALVALLTKNTISLARVFNGCTGRIRDEAYLIGERLHNFGAAAAGARRVRGAWRAGGGRL